LPQARTIRIASLAFVLAASFVPAALVAVLLVGYDYYQRERVRLVADSLATTHALSAAVDAELGGVKAALLALATSPHLDSGNLAAFHAQALAALRDQSFTNIVLIDQKAQQRLNTLRPFGAPLPLGGNPAQLQRIFETGQPVVTDLFVGPVQRKPLIAVGVPVRRDGAVPYSLNAGLSTERLGRILAESGIPPDWVAVILDSAGVIVARTHQAERFVGKEASPSLVQGMKNSREGAFEGGTLEGIQVQTVYTRSAASGWTVAIGIPLSVLNQNLFSSLSRLFIVAFVMLLVAFGLAALIGGWLGGDSARSGGG
jgi:hypothetical protein